LLGSKAIQRVAVHQSGRSRYVPTTCNAA
jgi:hypothetical protein